jgi:O-antigen/teichoic acid export membrane protein
LILRLLALADTFRKRLGMDRAIAYAFAARVCMIVGSTGTVLLIVRFLSKVQQGYYYTLLSLVNLQIIFELGFSFVVLQLAAHEAVHLRFHPNGDIEGEPSRHARLVAIFRKTLGWYCFAGLIMGATLFPAGVLFFSRTAPGTSSTWFWPWTCAASATVALFVLNPFCSFVEGCGQVRQVAGMRFAQAVVSVFAAWTCMLLGKGLYSPALVMVAYVAVAGAFLWSRRGMFRGLLRAKYDRTALSWRAEVWSFQWKIAITWLCSYFTVQVLTPVLFASRGAVEAGRMGMSVSIAGYLWNLVFAWMSTKAAPFGQLIAKREYVALDHLFFRTLWQSLAVLGVLVVMCMVAVLALQKFFPGFAARMVSPGVFVLLLLTAVSTLIVQSEAIYLRSHKEDPLMWQALAVAALTSAGAYFTAPRWGITGASIVYFLCTGIIGLVSATAIFRARRRSHQRGEFAAISLGAEAIL